MTDIIVTDTIDPIIRMALLSVSKSSQRVYRDTYDKWVDWCSNNRTAPININPPNLEQFLITYCVTKSTRQRQMSAMRQLLKIMAIHPDRPQYRAMSEMVGMMKVPEQNLSNTERDLLPLSPEQTDKILNFFTGDDAQSLRNQALVRFLFATGVRRSEAVAMEWRDINLHIGIAIIRHGKGDKRREVAIVGEYAIEALKSWKIAQGQARRYIFCPLTNQQQLGADKPISPENCYRIVKIASKATGIDYNQLRGEYKQLYPGYTMAELHKLQRDDERAWSREERRWIIDLDIKEFKGGIIFPPSNIPDWQYAEMAKMDDIED